MARNRVSARGGMGQKKQIINAVVAFHTVKRERKRGATNKQTMVHPKKDAAVSNTPAGKNSPIRLSSR